MRSEPALTREPGDLPVAVVLRADRVCRADGGEPERRHVWTAFSRRRVVRLTASAPLASVALRSGVPANVEVCFLFVPFAVHCRLRRGFSANGARAGCGNRCGAESEDRKST